MEHLHLLLLFMFFSECLFSEAVVPRFSPNIVKNAKSAIKKLKGDKHPKWYPGIFRVNTDISAGEEPLERVAEKAYNAGLKFMVVSDQFVVKVQYGLPILRDLLSYSQERKSIVTYGIEKYLKRIAECNKFYKGKFVILPGADIAPHYYFTGSPWEKNLTVNQYSEQLTVFGNFNPEFYKKFPVIHNDRWRDSFFKILLGLLPLLLLLPAFLFFKYAKRVIYKDRQGNIYTQTKKSFYFIAAMFALAAILFTLNNKPFTQKDYYDQYHDYGVQPFKKVIDYIRTKGNEHTGVIWSAPEAVMDININNVRFLTIPYPEHIKECPGANGFAGIYGDARTAHEPGKLWDKILLAYCAGKFPEKPVITGELDYHGKKRPINLIQTVVLTENFSTEALAKALIEGNSYAVEQHKTRLEDRQIVLDKVLLSYSEIYAYPGQCLIVQEIQDSRNLNLIVSGRLKITDKVNIRKDKQQIDRKVNSKTDFSAEIIIVIDGKVDYKQKISFTPSFTLNRHIFLPVDNKKHFARVHIVSESCGEVLVNPIFFLKN